MKIITFKQFLHEFQGDLSFKNILKVPINNNAVDEYHELYSSLEYNMIHDMISGKKQHFNLVRPEELKKIYKEHQEFGMIKNEKLLDSIIQRCIKNTAQLRVNTILYGHENTDPYEIYKDHFEDGELSNDEFNDLVFEYVPSDKISDYGLKWAEEIILRLMVAKNDNDKIVLLNHLFDIIHQRSDFAEYYVLGGKSALLQISGSEIGLHND